MGGALPADRFFDPACLEARYRLADAAVDRELLAATRVGASACVGVGVGKREGVRESVGGWVPVGRSSGPGAAGSHATGCLWACVWPCHSSLGARVAAAVVANTCLPVGTSITCVPPPLPPQNPPPPPPPTPEPT